MKYTGYTKKELLEVVQCLEHNCNVHQERADRQFGILINMQKKLDIAVRAIELARDTAYSSAQDCPKCAFIDEKLTKAIAKIKEIK